MAARLAYPLKMSASLKRAAERLASEDGVSLNQWINIAVAQKVGAVETAEHFRRRYGEPRSDDLRTVLDKRPDLPPEQSDEIPADLKARVGRT